MSKDELQQILINNINRLLIANNTSMRQLSTDIGCSDSYIQKVMTKEHSPSLDSLVRIADRYQIPVASLFEDDVCRSSKIQEIDTYLLSMDDDTLDAILVLTKRINSSNSK